MADAEQQEAVHLSRLSEPCMTRQLVEGFSRGLSRSNSGFNSCLFGPWVENEQGQGRSSKEPIVVTESRHDAG